MEKRERIAPRPSNVSVNSLKLVYFQNADNFLNAAIQLYQDQAVLLGLLGF